MFKIVTPEQFTIVKLQKYWNRLLKHIHSDTTDSKRTIFFLQILTKVHNFDDRGLQLI